ncbi:ParB/RepB/Spo0J family partition protein [Streptomyces sp. 2323.1]|uniref:ParB/RepB/Spo0J family partition protein n=1 Tax=Streptomyces sp. 2323.1 TaxID=1938841 RepID=UPI00133132B7|nr:ParB/RepB/Spo0J family partition protein [Streptomyces sp. 2323.1]
MPVDLLIAADTPRLNGVDLSHVHLLAQLGEFRPLLVHRQSMCVIDGMHRLAAAKLLGWATIDVRFFAGSVEDAFVEAVRANSAHGLPLTLADRKAAATRILRAHPAWSDRMIAGLVGLSPKTVGVVRQRLTEDVPQSAARVGRDGRVRRMPAHTLPCEAARGPGGEMGQHCVPAAVAAESDRSAPAAPAKRPHAASSIPDLRQEVDRERSQTTLAALIQDPSLRMTETGRFLLRLLELHLGRTQEWEQALANVPPHRAGSVADLAGECAKAWLDFQERVVRQSEMSGVG